MPFMKVITKGAGGSGAGSSFFQQWLYGPDGVADDAEDIVTHLRGTLDTYLRPQLSDSWSVSRFDAVFYPALGEEPYPTQVFTPTALVGGQNYTALAPRQTMLVEFKAFAQKPNRKRCYVGRYTENNNDVAGIPNSATVAAVQAWADHSLFEVNVNAHAWQFAVCRVDPQTGYVTAYHELNSHLVQTKWAFLRTRDVGHGT